MARKGGANADRLLSLIERVERLEEEKRQLAADIKDIFDEAKSVGFDPKVMKQMIKDRRMTPEQRQEWEALCQTYRAALGMLDGTPLGEAARRRFTRRPEPAGLDTPDSGTAPAAGGDDMAPPAAELSAEDIAKARAEGAVAAKAGRKVTYNPHPAGDRRRAAWDEGWCAASASDGMDIPDAWRRTKPKVPAKGDSKGADA